MAKNIIQDVIAKEKRSIREISINRVRRPFSRIENKKIVKEDEDYAPEEREVKIIKTEKRKRAKKSDSQKIILWLVAMLSLGFFLFSLSSYLSTATVIITSKKSAIKMDDSFIVKKNATQGDLQFEVMTLEKKMSKSLEATESKNLQIKASGKIVVYNNFNSTPQKFIKNTRFESESGLIYKIPESIIVPGKTVIAGKQVPGTVETEIFADEPGDKYNISDANQKSANFKIVGLKGDKKYDYFYGRLKGSVSGGVNGLVKKVSPKIYEDALSELRAGLKTELIKEAFSVKPESSILFENGYYIDFTSLPDKPLGNNKVEITESAAFYGIIFDRTKLSSFIANKKIEGFDGAPVELDLSDNSNISISSDSKVKPWESDSQTLSLKGDADIIWTYDKNALQKSLVGYSKSDLEKFKKSHSELSDISFVIRPFWKRSFPANPEKIKIVNSSLKNLSDNN